MVGVGALLGAWQAVWGAGWRSVPRTARWKGRVGEAPACPPQAQQNLPRCVGLSPRMAVAGRCPQGKAEAGGGGPAGRERAQGRF